MKKTIITPGRMAVLLAGFLFFCLSPAPLMAAMGCDLNYPDRDVARLFPGSTRFTSRYSSLSPDEMASVLLKLDERFRALYDPLNVPYTIYEIYNKDKKIGYIHGVNQKGQFGGLQVFVSLDLQGKILTFYIQKMSGRSAAKFREAAFGKQFVGLSLKDFNSFDPVSGKGTGAMAAIRNPAPDMETDFYSVLRALKKNLALMDAFIFSAKPEEP